jgi:hypothetical protein
MKMRRSRSIGSGPARNGSARLIMAALLLCTVASPQHPAAGSARTIPVETIVDAGTSRAAVATPSIAARTLAPRRLAIYYGIPSLVNDARGDVARAAAVFGEYDVVVFGDGLEFPDVVPGRTPPGAGPVERLKTAAITRALSTTGRRPAVFGYIGLGNSQNLTQREIERRIALWRETGAGGIFFDEAGYDFGVDRPRQNAAIDAVHAAGMRVFMNAFNPDDVFLPAKGLSHHLTSGDAYLLESFVVRNGKADDPGWRARARRALEHARRYRVAVHAVTTTSDPAGAASPELIAYAWWAALAYGVDGFGWGEPSFSGPDSALPWRARPEDAAARAGDRFVGAPDVKDGVYARRTNRGRIELDTRRHTGRFVPASG